MQNIQVLINERGIAEVKLCRPEKHNAFDDIMIEELIAAFETITNHDMVRVLVLSSEGKSFSAGADLNWMKRMAEYSKDENKQDAAQLAKMLHLLYSMPIPTIAKVQGAAYGGAVGLIACCDIAIASRLSKFCLSEVKLGLIPATISPYVIKALGARQAKRLFMTAEVFSSRRARRLGLLSENVSESELDSHVEEIIEAILKNGPSAVAAAKSLVHLIEDHPLNEDLIDKTSELIADIRVSKEGQEGLKAFLDKRSPTWVKSND